MMDNMLHDIGMSKQSIEYRTYLMVRERVIDMLNKMHDSSSGPSDYWKEELAGFDYMLDASPLIIQKLREHCYHITGIRSSDYRGHHGILRDIYKRKLSALSKQDKGNLFVPESTKFGGFGFDIDNRLINLDTLKFYECLIALHKAGFLPFIRSENEEKKVILEIGAGWGGFAYQFKTICPRVTYIIIDLPQTLLFSAVYLKNMFPKASVLIYGDSPEKNILEDYRSYDFIFLPHYFINKIKVDKIDLCINMVSFQEMTSEQVNNYIRTIYELGCPRFYSMNRDISPYNKQIASVSSILKQYYSISRLHVLNATYVDLPTSLVGGLAGNIVEFVKKTARQLLNKSVYKYKHLAGIIKPKN